MKIVCTLFVLSIVLVNLLAGIRQAFRLHRKKFQKCHGIIKISMVRDADATDWREYKALPMIRNFWPRVEYDYVVGGRTFRGDQISFAKVGSSRISEIRKKLSRYPVGAVVTVFHNQENPEEAYLIHPGKHVYTSLLIVGLISSVGGLILFMVWNLLD